MPAAVMLAAMTLFWRVIAINTGLLLAATVALVVSPATVSATLTIAELAVLALGVVIVTGDQRAPAAPRLRPARAPRRA